MDDLSPTEQRNVRTAIRYLHLQGGSWMGLAKLLRYEASAVAKVLRGGTGRMPYQRLPRR
jgi:hypothetical protein